MHTMMRRCIEHPLQGAKLVYQLRMDPELIQKIQLQMKEYGQWMHDKSSGEVEGKGYIALEYRLAHGSTEIVELGAVVYIV